jgi:hypothetical protein
MFSILRRKTNNYEPVTKNRQYSSGVPLAAYGSPVFVEHSDPSITHSTSFNRDYNGNYVNYVYVGDPEPLEPNFNREDQNEPLSERPWEGSFMSQHIAEVIL